MPFVEAGEGFSSSSSLSISSLQSPCAIPKDDALKLKRWTATPSTPWQRSWINADFPPGVWNADGVYVHALQAALPTSCAPFVIPYPRT